MPEHRSSLAPLGPNAAEKEEEVFDPAPLVDIMDVHPARVKP